ncbi:hypothetical protein BKA70DRAFT_1262009 [Coprinopsis sp. MPI-PUGE-AT-0042]|nr:hypothetical protein BKA70DRAFT_1262009 [Coprinopsis sp. MPI-PUGE-AT-0042]
MTNVANQSGELLAVQNNIERLQDAKTRLLSEIREIEQQLDIENARYATLRNNQNPVSRIPDELMSTIFMMVHHESRTQSTKKALKCLLSLSRICAKWRHIILTTSLLWNEIDMSFRYHCISEKALDCLAAHLARSGDCYLDMTLALAGSYQGPSSPWHLIGYHSKRWRRISLLINTADAVDLQSKFKGLEIPNLEHFSINVQATFDGGPTSPRMACNLEDATMMNTPRLRFLRLAGVALGALHPQSNLIETLHLDGWSRSFLTWSQLKGILEELLNLKSMSLYRLCIRHSGGPIEGPAPINLRTLQSLRVRDPYTPIDAILPLFWMPNLEHLFLQRVDTVALNSMPSLVGLHLETTNLDAAYVRMFITKAPNITTLSIEDCSFAALADSIGASHRALDLGQPLPWPHLRTLNVRQLSGTDVQHLVWLVSSRGLTESRLDTVTLDRRSRGALRAKHRLDMLADQVGVQNHDFLERWPPGLGYDDPHDLED